MRAVRWTIGALGEVMVTLGVLLLLFVVWQLWWTDVESNRDQRGAIQSLERDFGSGATAEPTKPAEPTSEKPKAVPLGDAFAIMRIPRLGADFAKPVYEGTDHDTLTRGVGHYAGTALNGDLGNFAVAGHRTTYGRPFHNIERLVEGDKIVVETKAGYDVYVVERHEIVRPTEVQVIAPVPDEPGERPTEAYLTLTACHPKYSAAYRYIVHAKLDQSYTRAEGLPVGTMAVPDGALSLSATTPSRLPSLPDPTTPYAAVVS